MTRPPEPEFRFYGRRKGKTLRSARLDAIETVLPNIAVPLDGDHAVTQNRLFDSDCKKIWLEIGFGNGEQLAHLAQNNPDIGMIGCEPFENGIAALCLDIKNKNIKNIRIWPDDARLLMKRLPPQSIDRCFVLNSDPWPKTRHHKRRFIQKDTLDELARILKPGAELRMSTDHPGLAAWQLEKTYSHPAFEWLALNADDWRIRPSDMLETRYQNKGMSQGRPTYFLNFRKAA